MVRIDRVVTRGGDGGKPRSAMAAGCARTRPASRRSARWTRRTAAIGLLRLHGSGETDAMLARIQNDLFDLGADLACPGRGATACG